MCWLWSSAFRDILSILSLKSSKLYLNGELLNSRHSMRGLGITDLSRSDSMKKEYMKHTRLRYAPSGTSLLVKESHHDKIMRNREVHV